MSVAKELTSDVTAFVLANKVCSPKEVGQLLISFHSTLQELELEERRRRHAKLALKNSLSRSKSAASTNNGA